MKGDKERIRGERDNGGKGKARREEMENSEYICGREFGFSLESLRKWGEEKEEGVRMLIGGNFNARTEREGRGVENEGEKREVREGRKKEK